jgi:FtsP/CotA-like multicopper oxidase with cupredoxin domain
MNSSVSISVNPFILSSGDPAPLTLFADSLPIPVIKNPYSHANEAWDSLKIRMLPCQHVFHSELASVNVWAYEGTVPGPMIEVYRDQKVRVEWANELRVNQSDSLLPIKVVKVPEDDGDNFFQNSPGSGTGEILPNTEGLKGWTVVHLHGGRTTPESDGWPENTAAPGQTRFYEYDNNQRATQLWYHDHAVHVTRLNVYSGLAGLWTIRDQEEDNLDLPNGQYEVPLFIQDVNFETQDQSLDGTLAPKLLHKTVNDVPEFFGPFTMVNGKVWPYLDVERRWYRLRLLNGSNARTYRLSLYDQAGKLIPFNKSWIVQIGCDQGLLDLPVALPDNGLILASSERADILIDFSGLPSDVSSLVLVNTAPAPFDGMDSPPPQEVNEVINLSSRLRWPWVMQFRLKEAACEDSFDLGSLPSPLSEFTKIGHDQLHVDHQHRLIALVEVDGEVTLRELQEISSSTSLLPIIEIQDEKGQKTSYITVSQKFDDATTLFVAEGEREVWKFINLTEDTHPIHIHLVELQGLRRQLYKIDTFDNQTGSTVGGPIVFESELSFDANEQGPKDVIRVNPKEIVSITALFGPFTGRYIYHCHILEHEDHDMMRTFVILPKPVLEMHMSMGSGHGGSGHHM